MSESESAVILPAGVHLDGPTVGPLGPGKVVIDNRTDLPDQVVEGAVLDHFVENSSLAWGHGSTFQTYANEGGSLLSRTKFRVPTNVFEEIKLARDIAERDDDVRSTIGGMIAVAYSEGMQNFHEEERTVELFNEAARAMGLDHQLKEIYREYLIAGQVTTVQIFTRQRFSFNPSGTGQRVEERVVAPLIGMLPAEQIRIAGQDVFGQGDLAYIPDNEDLRKWLEEFFSNNTTAARRNAMRQEDPVAAALFVERVKIEERRSLTSLTTEAYKLNPRMAARFTMPKGANPYPRPLLTANFALIEAKRLLNIMDFALLQGGANFIVVAKKGSDVHKASPQELANLGQIVQRASRTGVIVGDHRLSFEIITPKLDELLNDEKRSLIGRKLANLLLRVSEPPKSAGTEAMKAQVEITTRVITSDRQDVRRHVEGTTYTETAKRNPRLFKSPPMIWHPKIILQGANFFNDMVLKLRDRGDIPRKFVVEAAGFPWEAGVEQRKRELAANVDQVMAPAAVPFSSPSGQPTDNFPGRPPGSGPGNGAPGQRPGPGQDPAAPRRMARGPGEPVKAWWDEELGETIRVGEVTYQLLEQYPDREDGRITAFERTALDSDETASDGPVTVVPVNHNHATDSHRMLRLAPGFGIIVGYRISDEALVTKALCFRQPEFDQLAAEELAMRLGYLRPVLDPPEES